MKMRVLVWTGVLLALGTVFGTYLAPGMAATLAAQLWACF